MFTTVHLHLLLNHLPIIVPVIGFVLLALAAWRGSDLVARVGLALLAAGAVSALPAYLTGEGAEEAVEHLPGVTEALIDHHSDIALVAALVLGAVGLLALWTLWRYRRPAALPKTIVRLTLAAAAIGCGFMAYAGLLGGQIRHTEVRPGYIPPAEGGSATSHDDGDRTGRQP